MWGISFGISLGILILACFTILLIKFKHKNTFARSMQILMVGVFLSAGVLFLPVYTSIFQNDVGSLWKTILLSVHTAIRLFVVDCDFEMILSLSGQMPSQLYSAYALLSAVLFVFAPTLTCGFILSFFRNILTYYSILLHFKKDVYVFSELSENSVALAESIRKKQKQAILLFTSVVEVDDGTYEWKEKARQLKAHCLKDDITALHLKHHSRTSKMYFFIMGSNEGENVESALSMIPQYRRREHTRIYVFASSFEGEMLLNSIPHGQLKVRRVDKEQLLIFHTLYNSGEAIYAVSEPEKTISAVVVGLGRYGLEMLKALTWFGQMDGYHLVIHAYDENRNAEAIVSRACPELMQSDKNGVLVKGEAAYQIDIHSGINVLSAAFIESIHTIPTPTYVFVALGSEHKNMETALQLRTHLARKGIQPKIQVAFYDTYDARSLQNTKNFKGQSYQIEVVGDVKSIYSENMIINSELEAKALKRHMKWGREEDFWAYEYNYRSSIACEIHKKMKSYCKIPGADLPVEERTESEKEIIRILEHKRWNAYMRSEGYCYGEKRDDIAKTHPCLIPYDELSEEEKRKDDD